MRLRTSTKLAVASLLCRFVLGARRLAGLGREADVTRDGLRWHLDLTEGIDLAIYLFGRFESRTVRVFRQLVQDGDVVIDVGANMGANTLELARCVGPSGRVIAFEPTDFAFERLKRNLALNPELSRRVTAERAILGTGGRAQKRQAFYSSWPLVTGAGPEEPLHPRHRGRLQSAASASQWSLDDYLRASGITSVRLVKLDVDGNERSVLEGAKATLETLQPDFVMEVAPYVLDEHPGSLETIVGLFRDAGYGFADIDSRRRLPLDAEALRRGIADGASINVLARRIKFV